MLKTGSKALWLPFTQMHGFDASKRSFARGEGAYLFDVHGNRYFDAVSSIWTTVHGHCHPHIVKSIATQAAQLDHATLLGASNPRAEELADRLEQVAGLPHVFYSGDGASAVEAALKMALHYWRYAGQPRRTRFVHLMDSYHGDTAAAMSVSDIDLFKSSYEAITFETRTFSEGLTNLNDVAAVIVEPVVQAAAGMRVIEPAAYAPLARMEPLLIVDEIATGFGRTGSMFAYTQAGLLPDIICLGKGLTGGALALSATLASDRIYNAFLGAPLERKQFFHGHSYAGNPIACAAAITNLELFESERTLEHAALVADAIRPALVELAGHRLVREVRGAGLMIGIELAEERIDRESWPTAAWRVTDALYERGHFTRPIGDVIQLVPPLSSTAQEAGSFITALAAVLDELG